MKLQLSLRQGNCVLLDTVLDTNNQDEGNLLAALILEKVQCLIKNPGFANSGQPHEVILIFRSGDGMFAG